MRRKSAVLQEKPKLLTKVYLEFLEIKNTFSESPKDRNFHFEIMEEKSDKSLFKSEERKIKKEDAQNSNVKLDLSMEIELDSFTIYKINLSVVRI